MQYTHVGVVYRVIFFIYSHYSTTVVKRAQLRHTGEMNPAVRLKQLALVVGDILMLYCALGLTLIIRYGLSFSRPALDTHLKPFSIIFLIWILVFYINGLYEIHKLKNGVEFLKRLGGALLVTIFIAVAFFYVFTDYGIAPKTNLFIFIIISFLLGYVWRGFYNTVVSYKVPTTPLAIIGDAPSTQELARMLHDNPQLGYIVTSDIDQAELIVVPSNTKYDARTTTALYHYATAGVEVIDTTTFYEIVFQKVPIAELEEAWFIKHLINRHTLYDFVRLPIEITSALILGVVLFPLLILIACSIKLSSRGPVIFKQTRVGELGKTYTLYKFRSMIADAEKNGPQWKTESDPRLTTIGRILMRAHLDELPQLFNIIKGDLSFVGPRPERPEFVEQLKNKIPYYELRHLVKPGITGWAQLHYGYGASIEDAQEKLQYDLYYLKNRSFWLDVEIILKTIKLFFTENY